MSASRVALLASVACVVAWGLKAVAIGVAGGLDRSPFEGPLFVLGLVAIVLSFSALGIAITSGRSVMVKVLGALAGVLVGFALSMVASAVADSATPDSAGWVGAEAGLWLSALLALGVMIVWHSRTGARRIAP